MAAARFGGQLVAVNDAPESTGGEAIADEVDSYEPGREEVRKVVEKVGVGDAVDGGVHGNGEEDKRGDVLEPGRENELGTK